MAGKFVRLGRPVSRITPHTAADALVIALVLILGAFEFLRPLNADGFFRGDTVYIEYARSILERGHYGLDFNDIQYPPGLPALLVLLCKTVACTHAALVRSMAVVLTLALIASYRLLKREEGTAVAATACLLIASSPLVFEFATQSVSSDVPYFFTSVATLLLAAKLDDAAGARNRMLLALLCAVMLAMSLMIRSSAVALIAGLVGWLAIGSWATDPPTRTRRWRSFSGVVIVAIVVQAAWMGWVAKHEVVEWPMLEGYPRTYVSQLIVKSGIEPELGTASLPDFLSRVPANVAERAVGLMQFVTRREYLDSDWYSPLVLGTVLLIGLGLGSSLRAAGGSLAEWYFIGHEAMYAVWPWPYESRFLLPVVPLALLYLWRGSIALGRQAVSAPRAVGAAGVSIGLLAAAAAAVAGWRSGSMQAWLSAFVWSLIVIASICMISPSRAATVGLLRRILLQRRILPAWPRPIQTTLPQTAGAIVATGLVVLGLALQADVARQNSSFDVAKHRVYERIVAARWIAEHTPGAAVVMARQMDVVHHYANRKVVWFPPISDARTLVDGIRRLGVDYIVVTDVWTYYVPTEDDCIAALLKAYPQAFNVVHQGSRFKIIQVVRDKLPTDAV